MVLTKVLKSTSNHGNQSCVVLADQVQPIPACNSVVMTRSYLSKEWNVKQQKAWNLHITEFISKRPGAWYDSYFPQPTGTSVHDSSINITNTWMKLHIFLLFSGRVGGFASYIVAKQNLGLATHARYTCKGERGDDNMNNNQRRWMTSAVP